MTTEKEKETLKSLFQGQKVAYVSELFTIVIKFDHYTELSSQNLASSNGVTNMNFHSYFKVYSFWSQISLKAFKSLGCFIFAISLILYS